MQAAIRHLVNAVVTVGQIAAFPAVAQGADLIHNKLEPYTVTESLVSPDACADDQFDSVTRKEFDKAVCLFHNRETAERNLGAIDLMQQAQRKGLPPVHQNFSALLSGLLHCRQANRHLEEYRQSENQSLLARAQFCRERRMSMSSFSDVDWEYAYFDYEPSARAGFSLDARLDEMSACYGGALDPAFNAECGLIANISNREIEAFVDEATEAVIEKFFTGAESPITAMFVRKVNRAEGLKTSAATGIENLEQQAGPVNAKYDKFQSVYTEAKEGKIEPIYASYRTAVLKANSIMDEFNRWKDGLFITSENVNLLPKIRERKVEIDEELERIQADQFQPRAEALTTDISRLFDADNANRDAVVQLCRIYYCEMANRRALGGLIQVCRRPGMQGNPLCIEPDQSLRRGTLEVDFNGPLTVDVAQFCADSGLETEHAAVGLGPQASNACLQSMP